MEKLPASIRRIRARKRGARDKQIITAKRSDASQALLTHRRKPLRLDRHSFFVPVYDLESKMVLLKCGRQVAKCCHKYSELLDKSGAPILIHNVEIGDEVCGLDQDESHISHGKVTWKSEEYKKDCVRITTRQGHEIIVGKTHPMRCWGKWVHAGDLLIGDKVAVVRGAGEFIGHQKSDAEVSLIAYMIAEGYCPDKEWCTFTQVEGVVLDEFIELITDTPSISQRRPDLYQLRFNRYSDLLGLIKEAGLHGALSEEKRVPDFVWDLDQRQTALFLNRIWAGDGSAGIQGSSYMIEYTSISLHLARDVQGLLWKFGIPTSMRRWKPTLYKDTDKWAYRLRIETQDGARRFIEEIGALGKTEDLPLLDINDNSNRDTYPIEIENDIKAINRSRKGFQRRGRFVPQPSLRSAGLRERLKYPPSRSKLKQYVDFFRSVDEFNQELVSKLAEHIDTDLFWDEIEKIEDVGEQPCYDITVEGTDSFVADGFVTHNSTTLCNLLLIESLVHEAFRSLYVSPSSMQSRQFSNEKLTPTIQDSPFVQDHYIDKTCIRQVYEKTFTNGSHIFLRYAFLTADRCISGDSRMQMMNGSLRSLRELAKEDGPWWIIASDEAGRPVSARCTRVWKTGHRPVVEIKTTMPVPLKVTRDHLVKAHRGWVKAEDIQEGDFVCCPHVAKEIKPSHPLSDDMAWIIGAMISEGTSKDYKRVSFCNTDWEFFQEFCERAGRCGIELGTTVVDSRYCKDCYTVNLYNEERGSGKNGSKSELWEFGEFGKASQEKNIPRSVFSSSLEAKCSFLYALFKGDGWHCPEGNGYRAGYCTASKELAHDLVMLLWSIGIRSSIYKKKPSAENALGSYTVSLSCSESEKLVLAIGSFRGEYTSRIRRGQNHHDRIPISYDSLKRYIKREHGLSTHSAWKEYRIQLRPGNRKDSIGRSVLKSIAEKLKDCFLASLCDGGISWAEVKSVDSCGEDDVYDFSVPSAECASVNGYIVHNCRGIPADRVFIDEIQDILKDNVKIITECLSFSDYGYELYAGTPKTFDNTIEEYWKWSTQMEWAVPCEKHTPVHWNILGIDNIGKEHLICSKCGGQIYPESGQWVVTNPGAEYVGFHVTQLMVSWKQDPERWKREIVWKFENWSDAQFHNEVLGESYDQASKPITQTELMQCCHPVNTQHNIDNSRLYMTPEKVVKGRENYAGVDWGEGRAEGRVEGGKKKHASWTVLTIGTWINSTLFWPFFIKRYEGKEVDPEFIKVDIVQKCHMFGVNIIGVDWGHGWGMNSHLINRLGRDKVMEFQYVPKLKPRIKWDKQSFNFKVNRSLVISEFIDACKGQELLLPPWEAFQPFGKDILGVYVDYNERMKTMYYDHPMDQPDDAMHSLIYARMAGLIAQGRF